MLFPISVYGIGNTVCKILTSKVHQGLLVLPFYQMQRCSWEEKNSGVETLKKDNLPTQQASRMGLNSVHRLKSYNGI